MPEGTKIVVNYLAKAGMEFGGLPKGAGGKGEARKGEKGTSGNKEDRLAGAGGLLTKDGEMGKGHGYLLGECISGIHLSTRVERAKSTGMNCFARDLAMVQLQSVERVTGRDHRAWASPLTLKSRHFEGTESTTLCYEHSVADSVLFLIWGGWTMNQVAASTLRLDGEGFQRPLARV